MVDKRLEDIHTSEMADSAVNVELVEWLKTYGLNIALVVLMIVAGTRGYFWLADRRAAQQSELWERYATADQVVSLRELAREAEGVGSLPELALLQAADIQLSELVRNESSIEIPSMSDPSVDSDDDANDDTETPEGPLPLTSDERADLINSMEALYNEVATATVGAEDFRRALHIKALFGLASCQEMRGDYEDAIDRYDEIETMVENDDQLSGWTVVAVNRRESIDRIREKISLPTQAERRDVMAPPPSAPPLLERPEGDGATATEPVDEEPVGEEDAEGEGENEPASEDPGDDGGQ